MQHRVDAVDPLAHRPVAHGEVVEPVEERVGDDRGRRWGERVRVDEVGRVLVEMGLELAERDSGLDDDVHGVMVDLDDAIHARQVEHQTSGARDGDGLTPRSVRVASVLVSE